MDNGILEKTGKALEQWIEIVHHSGIKKHKEIMALLQNDHGYLMDLPI